MIDFKCEVIKTMVRLHILNTLNGQPFSTQNQYLFWPIIKSTEKLCPGCILFLEYFLKMLRLTIKINFNCAHYFVYYFAAITQLWLSYVLKIITYGLCVRYCVIWYPYILVPGTALSSSPCLSFIIESVTIIEIFNN